VRRRLARCDWRLNRTGKLAESKGDRYNSGVARLTKQERRVLGIILLLLALGWVVKTHRAAPPVQSGPAAGPGAMLGKPAKP